MRTDAHGSGAVHRGLRRTGTNRRHPPHVPQLGSMCGAHPHVLTRANRERGPLAQDARADLGIRVDHLQPELL